MSGIITDNLGRSSGLVKAAGGGTILSVKSMEFTGTTSRSGIGQISSFDMSFAPTTADSKLLFQVSIGSSTASDGSGTNAFYIYDVTNTTIIGAYGASDGSRLQVSWKAAGMHKGYDTGSATFGCWHEPGTITSRDYTVYGGTNSGTLYINTNHYNYNVTDMDSTRPASTFTITEYAADAVTLT